MSIIKVIRTGCRDGGFKDKFDNFSKLLRAFYTNIYLFKGFPFDDILMVELPVYCMSKAAVDMFTQCLALELAPFGVKVNTVSPGAIVSKIARRGESGYHSDEDYQKFLVAEAAKHPLGRVGVPQDVTSAISFLSSDEASFISDQILYVDGARHCLSAGVTTSVK